MGMFYRLFDKQTGRYMATGYNSTSLNELIESYSDYFGESDWDDEDLEIFNNLSKSDKLKQIESNEFVIEKSKRKFEENLL